MHFVYVLYSLKDKRLYKGYSTDVAKRMLRHNSGGNKSTAHRKPFVLVHIESFEDKSKALSREKYLKTAEAGFCTINTHFTFLQKRFFVGSV